MKYNKKKRDLIGCMLAFVLGLLTSGVGVIIMSYREKLQSRNGGFPIEADDLYNIKYVVL